MRGLGFMLAMEFVTDRQSKAPDPQIVDEIMNNARARGLLVIKCGVHRNVIRFLGPLIVTEAEIKEVLKIMDLAIGNSAKHS